MKKLSYLTLFACLAFVNANAQAPRFVLFEHFTQASCGPCAAQNPGFKAAVLDKNPLVVRHIAYHTSWPGVDPMYNHNPSEVDSRVSFYSVTGVPDVYLMGSLKNGAPASFNQTDVNNTFSSTSPVKIKVDVSDTGSARNVTVTVTSLATPPQGIYKIFTSVIEREIVYANPPGSTNEKEFPNVFRKMLPSISGEAIILPDSGNSIVFNYNFTENAVWNEAELAVLSFVQESSTKEILNVGSSFDPTINTLLIPSTQKVKRGTGGIQNTFSMQVGNSGSVGENFSYKLVYDAPQDWNVAFTVNSTTSTDSLNVLVNANSMIPLDVQVVPGTTPGIAKISIQIRSLDNPNTPVMHTSVSLISGVTDLVISNTNGRGDGLAGNGLSWESNYTNALTAANVTAMASADQVFLSDAIKADVLIDVDNVYFNIGWTFPSITTELANDLKVYLNAGGNLFVAGQDIGWELNDGGSPYMTAALRNFYRDYLMATFVSDGSPVNNKLNAESADGVFGILPESGILSYYGASYLYPDQMNPTANSKAIFVYNNTATKKAGVRGVLASGAKVVYLGIGLEMVADVNVKNQIIKLSHDWFNGLLSNVQYDEAMMRISMGQNYPNPANTYTRIDIENIDQDMILQVIDLNGKILLEQDVNPNSTSVDINTSNLSTGMYMYRLTNGKLSTASKSLQIIR